MPVQRALGCTASSAEGSVARKRHCAWSGVLLCLYSRTWGTGSLFESVAMQSCSMGYIRYRDDKEHLCHIRVSKNFGNSTILTSSIVIVLYICNTSVFVFFKVISQGVKQTVYKVGI